MRGNARERDGLATGWNALKLALVRAPNGPPSCHGVASAITSSTKFLIPIPENNILVGSSMNGNCLQPQNTRCPLRSNAFATAFSAASASFRDEKGPIPFIKSRRSLIPNL